MSLFNSGTSRQANPTHSDNLRLQPPSTLKLATFVAAADEKSVENDHVYYQLNEDKTKAFNRKKTSLPTSARQELYDLTPWHVGLDEDDLHVSLNELNIPQQAPKFTVTLVNDPMDHLREINKTHKSFYIFPTSNKRDPAPRHLSSRKWSQALKQFFADSKTEDDQKAYTGWITMESWERHTKAKNHLLFAAGPLIDLKWAVDKVVCHHRTKALFLTRAFSLKQGYTPERPLVSIHINTAHQPSDPIDFCDLDTRGLSLDEAL